MTGYQPGIVWILKRTQGRIQMSGLHSSDTQWTAITETECWFLHHESVSDCQFDQGTSLSHIAMYSFYRSPQALNIGTCLAFVMECHASINKCFQVSTLYMLQIQWSMNTINEFAGLCLRMAIYKRPITCFLLLLYIIVVGPNLLNWYMDDALIKRFVF